MIFAVRTGECALSSMLTLAKGTNKENSVLV